MKDAGGEVGLDVAQWGVSVMRQHQKQAHRTSQVWQLQHPHLMACRVLELAWGWGVSGQGISSVTGAWGTQQWQTPGRVSSQTWKQCILLTSCPPGPQGAVWGQRFLGAMATFSDPKA